MSATSGNRRNKTEPPDRAQAHDPGALYLELLLRAECRGGVNLELKMLQNLLGFVEGEVAGIRDRRYSVLSLRWR